ncbi:ABC transporter permease [Kurthia sibirica]|uniref:Putative hemin transport system permease protein HrtB n=1 Tax=Kurthia sibirica TaxID=202750 RepID=A0A2U3AKK5_9BACL|nr:ABC transporter permease [Kurthia sibirica]PWI25069.1 ABC transporter permease [Kurthia sibirica]GEK34235.1 ABC transporter permease [Kurthia sibirica]
MFSLSLKEIRFFKLRYVLIGFILFFVAALVFIISGLANGLANDNASAMKNMNATSYYVTKDSENRMDRSRLTATDVEKIDNSNAQPLGIQMLSLKNQTTDKKVDVTLMTVNPKQFLMPAVIAGDTITNSSKNEAVVDNKLEKEGAKIGDFLYDENTKSKIKIVGFTENQTYSHTPTVIVNNDTWYTIFGGKDHSAFNAIAINSDSAATKAAVSKVVADGKWVEKDDLVKTIPGYEAEQSSLYMMLAFLIVIAVFVLGAFFYIMTIQKVNQFGILKAIGAKNSFLIGSTMLQVFILSIVSIGLAIGFAFVLQKIMPAGIPFVFDFALIFQFGGALLAVSLLGALFSTISIVKADPLQAMGRAE